MSCRMQSCSFMETLWPKMFFGTCSPHMSCMCPRSTFELYTQAQQLFQTVHAGLARRSVLQQLTELSF